MFTGIVRDIGTVARIHRVGGDLRLTIESGGLPWTDYDVGDSIMVNGVCLTAVELSPQGFVTDVSAETIAVTALSALAEGARVNLEPALAVGERLGGHLVSGHVDCIGVIAARHGDARSVRLAVTIPPDYARYVAKKGSVCVDGISLTVNEVSAQGFEVNIIPHTAEVTIAAGYAPGTEVNIEVDLLARYLERLLGRDEGGISEAFLRENGYA